MANVLDDVTSLPISRPLKNVEEVFKWKPGFDPFCVAKVALKQTKKLYPDKPKTLVCHDMQGGYREDRFVQGYDSNTCYRINHWNFIDVFVYFSHNIVTIPPPCWINTCHRHGVKVLGTFITEWEDGAKTCATFLGDEVKYQQFARQLVDISSYYNFDGWLINIENNIVESQVKNLAGFVSFLTKTMHSAMPGSEVIWYDSVTNKGDLDWQNELNSSNSLFFESCDGIFLNYTWSVQQLSTSANNAGASRRFDVYVGVDCFGRGCFGGGGWNTYQALQVIRQQNLSAAIFAPGWVLESQGKEHFTRCQNRFWNLLVSYLYPHVVAELPLVSSFCQGYGECVFSHGNRLVESPWTNLSRQQLQPTYFDHYQQTGPKQGFEIKEISYSTAEGYLGGGCIKVEGIVNSRIEASHAIFSLFACSCDIKDPIFVAVTFNLDKDDAIDISLLLSFERERKCLVLGPNITGKCEREENSASIENNTLKVGSYVLSQSRELHGNHFEIPNCNKTNSKFYQPLCGSSHKIASRQCMGGANAAKGWQSRYYIIAEKDLSALTEIKFVCASKSAGVSSSSPFALMLGELKILNLRDLVPTFPRIVNIRQLDTLIEKVNDKKVLSTTIAWDCSREEPGYTMTESYSIFCKGSATEEHITSDGVFLGRAYVNLYRVTRLELVGDQQQVHFLIRPVSECNICADKEHCATFTVKL